MMKRIAKRIISTMLCLCMLAGMIAECGGVSALAQTVKNWDKTDITGSTPENKNLNAELGTEENPFTILEIVPEYCHAQIGYMIPGCEPIDVQKVGQEEEGYSQIKGNLASQGVIDITTQETKDCYLEDIPYGAEMNPWDSTAASYINQYRSDITILPQGQYKNQNCWTIQGGPYTDQGYYEKTEDGQGAFKRNEDGSFSFASVKKENEDGSIDYEKDGCYKWVKQDFPSNVTDGYEDGDKVWKNRTAQYKFSIKKYVYTNNDIFIQRVYGISSENFRTQVITLTTEDLNQKTNRKWIEVADLITIHDARAQTGIAKVWNTANGKNADDGVETTFASKDLGYDATMAIVERMSSSNPAAVIMDAAATFNAGEDTNVHKLFIMLLQYEPAVFMQLFGEKENGSYKYLLRGDNDKVVYKPTYQNSQIVSWKKETFQYSPTDANVSYITQMRFDNIHSGGYNVVENIYTYHGDTSMFQEFAQGGTISDKKTDNSGYYHTSNVTSEAFDYYEYVNGTRPKTLSNLDAVHYILQGSNYKPKLRILEIQPCNKFIYDNTNATTKAAWKKYYKSIFPWYQPKNTTDDSWMENPNYLQIDTMTTYEFIGCVGAYDYDENLKNKVMLTADSSDDLIAKYDMIIIGSNQDESNGLNGYNDTSLGHLIYTSVGDLIVSDSNIKKYVKDENGNLVPADLSNEINDRKCRYSGNDLTLKKILELQDFLRAGKPVVVDDGLYQITNQGGVPKCEVDTTKVDKSSKLYDLLTWTDSSSYNGSQNLFIHGQINSSFMKKTLAYEYCRLTFYQPQNLTESPYPVEYNYSTKDTSYGKDAIDQAVYTSKNADGTATLKYYFTIQGSAAKDYRVYMNIDGDGDGVYTGSLKNQTEVVRMNVALGYATEEDYTVNANGWALKAGVNLSDSAAKFDKTESARKVRIKDVSGIYLGVSNAVILKANTRYCAEIDIPSYQQGIIPWKLEVHEESNPYRRSSAIDYTAVLNQSETEKLNVLQMCPTSDMKTNPPVLYFTRQKVKVNGVFNSAIEYTTQSEPMTLTGNTLTNVNKFETFLEPVKEFNVNIQFLMNKDWRTLFQVTGMSESDKLANWKAFLSQYDMIILGFKDMANFTNDKVFVDGLKDFIAQGKSVIVSHDMAQYEPNDGGGVGADTANYKYMPWLTTVSGQRRAYYNKSGDTYVKSYSETYQNGELLSLLTGVGDGDTFIRQLSEEIDGDSIEDELIGTWVNDFINNPNRLLPYMNGKGNVDRTNLKYDRLNNTINLSWPPTTTKVALTNQGQITRYPYRLGNEINVAKTHTQYYQLDLEYEKGGDVNVWFNLTDGPYNTYKSRYQDSRNNFFIYNKGNITYTGSGHRAGDLMPDDEVKLFINTMIAAYRVPEAKPAIEITNADTTGNNDVSVIYLDTDENITGTSVDGNVIERDRQKVVAVKFRIIDTAETSSGGDKNHKLLLYKDGSMVDGSSMKIYHYDSSTDAIGAVLTNFTESKTGQVGYDVTASEQGDDYIMFVPYSEITSNGSSTYRLSTYATYKAGDSATEKVTPTSSANITIMFMPLFNLN